MIWQTLVAALAATVILAVPGLVAVAPLRGGLLPRFALGSAAAVVSIGISGVIFGSLGIRFQAWQPLVVAVAMAAGTWLIGRRWARASLPSDHGARTITVLAWIAVVGVVAAVLLSGLPNFDRVSQTYDNVFHLSAVASILQDGNASSLTLRTIIETDRSWAYYPAAWHSVVALVVQLTGVEIAVAANATWLAVVAVVWLPGVVWLAQCCLHRYPSVLIALVALPLGAAFGWMPYGLLTWGTLYPTFLATALLPVAVAIPVAGWVRLRNAHKPSRVVVSAGAALATALLAIAFSQPRVLASWGVIIAIPALGIAIGSIARLWKRGGRARRRMLWTVAAVVSISLVMVGVGLLYLIGRMGLFDRPLDDRLGGPQAQATQTVIAGLWQVISVSTQTGVAGAITWPALLLGAAVIVGSVAAVRMRDLGWVVYCYAVFGIFYALAAGSDDVFSKLITGIWYKDRYRLSSILPVLGVVLATLGILVAARWMRRKTGSAEATDSPVWPSTLLAWFVTVISVVTLCVSGMSVAIATVFALADGPPGSAIVSKAQIDFISRLDEYVPAGQRVLGDPWDGSSTTWVFGDREPVFPHVNGQWDADRQTLAWSLADINSNPGVCEALNRLRVRHVLYNPHEFGGGDPSGNHFPGPHQAVEASLFTPVATDGDSTLYLIEQCGELP